MTLGSIFRKPLMYIMILYFNMKGILIRCAYVVEFRSVHKISHIIIIFQKMRGDTVVSVLLKLCIQTFSMNYQQTSYHTHDILVSFHNWMILIFCIWNAKCRDLYLIYIHFIMSHRWLIIKCCGNIVFKCY